MKIAETTRLEPSQLSASIPADLAVARQRYHRPARKMTFGNELAFSISDDSISAAHCRHFPGSRKLVEVRKVYIPRDLKDPDHRRQFITGAVDDICHDMGGRWKSIALAIGGNETAYRRLTMPAVGARALKAAIQFEAKRQIPFPIADCHYAFRPIANVTSDSEAKVKVALVAGTRRLIDEYLAPFRALNIPIEAVYLSTDVVGRLLDGMPQFDPESNYCLINIERLRSEISYYRGTELEFSHVISLGSQFLANRRDDTVFEYFTESLVNELQNSLDFYAGQYANRFSNQVYVYGDLSYTDDLIDRLSGHLEFDFHRFPIELVKSIEYQSDDARTSAAVCLPVVAAAVNNLLLPNLLPDDIASAHSARRIDRWAISGIGILAAILGWLWLWSGSSVTDASHRLASIQAEIDQFKASSLYASYDSLKQQMAFDQAYLAKSQATPSFASAGLKEISILTPPEIRLYDYAVSSQQGEKNGRMAGIVRSTATPPELILAEFVERLRQSPVFTQVTVDGYQKKIESGSASLLFQITMTERL